MTVDEAAVRNTRDLDTLVKMADLDALNTADFVSKPRPNHPIDLIDVALVDGSWLSRLPEELSIRLKELLDNPED